MVLSLTELGKRLEEARLLKNLTLDELQEITKIQKRYLQAIEAGNYDILPGKFYARAFIKQYAEAVGLDPEKIFDEFASEVPKTETEVTSGLSRAQKKQTPVLNTSSLFFSILPKLLVVVLVVSVAAFFWLYFQKNNGQNNADGKLEENVVESQEDENVTIVNPNEETEVPSEEEQQNEVPTDIEETPNGTETNLEDTEPLPEETATVQQLNQIGQKTGNSPTTTYELKGINQFMVELTSTGNSYIGIKNGKGKSFYGAELKEGEKISYDFSEEQEIELNIGRTLDVAIKINGQDFEFPFPPSEKVHQKIKITFNKEIQQ
ncbi:MAG TPA: helix-turn-helix domain-containing protein [Bacillus bacterium]|nr:helix-turn-helix domain-containing protein [Bacillus sp. (in: firmicutes)]